MLAELREAGIPTVEFDLAIGDRLVKRHGREFPFIVKVGSHHGGFSKALIEDGTQWSQIADLLFCADDFMTVEPYVEHERDLRCLMIGDQAWCMEQRGASWRANADTLQAKIVEPPTELLDYTQRIRTHLGATSVGVDALERADGSFVVLEVNDPPGLVGFPEEARRAIAAELLDQLRASWVLSARGGRAAAVEGWAERPSACATGAQSPPMSKVPSQPRPTEGPGRTAA